MFIDVMSNAGYNSGQPFFSRIISRWQGLLNQCISNFITVLQYDFLHTEAMIFLQRVALSFLPTSVDG